MYRYSKRISFSPAEIKDLLKSLMVIGLAYTIVMTGLSFNLQFLVMLIVSITTAGAAFLFHELAHKVVAHSYGCFAEFHADNSMLIITLLLSLLGMMFAAPGAVYIDGSLTKREYGKISAAGPATNILLALVFLGVALYFKTGFFQLIGLIGLSINAWIALFNMIPFGNFDGIKIWNWSKAAYFAIVLVAFVLTFGTRYLIASG